jgi:hypothetical protein
VSIGCCQTLRKKKKELQAHSSRVNLAGFQRAFGQPQHDADHEAPDNPENDRKANAKQCLDHEVKKVMEAGGIGYLRSVVFL